MHELITWTTCAARLAAHGDGVEARRDPRSILRRPHRAEWDLRGEGDDKTQDLPESVLAHVDVLDAVDRRRMTTNTLQSGDEVATTIGVEPSRALLGLK